MSNMLFLIFCLSIFLSFLILIKVTQWKENDKEDVTKIWVARGVLVFLPLIVCGGCYLCFEKMKFVDLVRPFYNSLGDVGKHLFLGGLISVGFSLLALLVGYLISIATSNSLKELEEMKKYKAEYKEYKRRLKEEKQAYNNE